MVIIEEMKSEDISTVSSLLIEVFNHLPIRGYWTIETSTAYLQETYKKHYSFVAKENGEIIGALVGYTRTYDMGITYYVENIMVKKEYRKKGIGTQLLQKAMQLGKEKNMKSIGLLANAKLESFQFYRALGFRETGWVDLIKSLV